jgi:hypothetical protein
LVPDFFYPSTRLFCDEVLFKKEGCHTPLYAKIGADSGVDLHLSQADAIMAAFGLREI